MANSNKRKHYYSKKRQTGLTLIELLISLVIGLFLLVGITSSYLSSKKNSIQRNEFSMLEDNGRLALEVLKSTIQHAGYSSTNGATITDKFMNDSVKSYTCRTVDGVGGVSVKNEALFSSDSTEDGAESDSIGVAYYGDSILSTDCAGQTLPLGCQFTPGANIEASRIYNAFYVDDNEQLLCAGSRADTAQVIADGVENLQVLYGVDANGDNSADRYVSHDDVNDLWGQVVNVQIGVLVKSSKQIKDVAESEVFTLLDKVITISPADRYQRAVFSTTITLRNSIN